jgi:hypothetical protein
MTSSNFIARIPNVSGFTPSPSDASEIALSDSIQPPLVHLFPLAQKYDEFRIEKRAFHQFPPLQELFRNIHQKKEEHCVNFHQTHSEKRFMLSDNGLTHMHINLDEKRESE